MPPVSWPSSPHSIPFPRAEGQRHATLAGLADEGKLPRAGSAFVRLAAPSAHRIPTSPALHKRGGARDADAPTPRHASSERPEPHPRQRCHGSGRALVFLREGSQVRRDLAEGATGCPIDPQGGWIYTRSTHIPEIHGVTFALGHVSGNKRLFLPVRIDFPERQSIPTLASKLTLRALIGRSENRA